MNPGTSFIKSHAEGSLLQLCIVPRASRNQIGEVLGGRLKIRITAPPIDSSANNELIRFLSKQFGASRSNITLVRGQNSRTKDVLIRGISIQEVVEKFD